LFYLIVEVIGGFWTGSLALLADAGHMLTDVAGVGLALLAIWYAEKPPSPERTYGYYRVEILAAMTNAVVLILISLYILYEAYERFKSRKRVDARRGGGRFSHQCYRNVYLTRRFNGKSEYEGRVF